MRISISSDRSVGDRPAAGSSNRMKRGAPDERQRDLELALLAVAQLGDALLLHAGEMHGLDQTERRLHDRLVWRGRSSEKRPRETPQQAR